LEFKLYAIEVLMGLEYYEPLLKVWSTPKAKINSDDKEIIIIIIILIIVKHAHW